MSESPLKFSQREYRSFPTLDLKGKLTGGPEAEEFRDLFKSLVQQGKKYVIINMRDVEWISSTGIGILIRGYKTIREAGGEIAMVRVNDKTQQVFNILRLDVIFKIRTDEDDAAEYLQQLAHTGA